MEFSNLEIFGIFKFENFWNFLIYKFGEFSNLEIFGIFTLANFRNFQVSKFFVFSNRKFFEFSNLEIFGFFQIGNFLHFSLYYRWHICLRKGRWHITTDALMLDFVFFFLITILSRRCYLASSLPSYRRPFSSFNRPALLANAYTRYRGGPAQPRHTKRSSRPTPRPVDIVVIFVG